MRIIKNKVVLVEVDAIRKTARIIQENTDMIVRVSTEKLHRLEEEYAEEFAGCQREQVDMTADALRDGQRWDAVTLKTTMNPINL